MTLYIFENEKITFFIQNQRTFLYYQIFIIKVLFDSFVLLHDKYDNLNIYLNHSRNYFTKSHFCQCLQNQRQSIHLREKLFSFLFDFQQDKKLNDHIKIKRRTTSSISNKFLQVIKIFRQLNYATFSNSLPILTTKEAETFTYELVSLV